MYALRVCMSLCGARQAMEQQAVEHQAIAGVGLDDTMGGDEMRGPGPPTKRFKPMCALTMAGNCLAVQEAMGTAGGGCVALTGQGWCHPHAWVEPLFKWREQLFAQAAASSVPSQESFCPFVLASVCKAWRLHVFTLISIDEEKERQTLESGRKKRMHELLERKRLEISREEWTRVEVHLQDLLDSGEITQEHWMRMHERRLKRLLSRGAIQSYLSSAAASSPVE